MHTDLLIKYLILYKKLSLPDIGSFAIEHRSAKLDFGEKKIYPPVQAITFTHENKSPDKDFYAFVAREKSTSELKAIEMFNEFIAHIKNEVKSNKQCFIPGLGILEEQYSNTYSYKPSYQVSTYLPTINGERLPIPEKPERPSAPITKKSKKKNKKHNQTLTVTAVDETEVHKEEKLTRKRKLTWITGAVVLFIIAVIIFAVYYLLNGRVTV